MVASVAETRSLVVVMRSVNQTYGTDTASLSGYWTPVDTDRPGTGPYDAGLWPTPRPPTLPWAGHSGAFGP